MCKRKTISLLLILVLLATGIASIGIVYATKPARESGDFTTISVVYNNIETHGGNTFIKYTATYDFNGFIDGISTVEGTIVQHANGKGNFHGIGTAIDCTVGGVIGSMWTHTQGTINFLDGTYQGLGIVTSSSGDFENLHLVFYIEGTLGTTGTYTAVYHWDP